MWKELGAVSVVRRVAAVGVLLEPRALSQQDARAEDDGAFAEADGGRAEEQDDGRRKEDQALAGDDAGGDVNGMDERRADQTDAAAASEAWDAALLTDPERVETRVALENQGLQMPAAREMALLSAVCESQAVQEAGAECAREVEAIAEEAGKRLGVRAMCAAYCDEVCGGKMIGAAVPEIASGDGPARAMQIAVSWLAVYRGGVEGAVRSWAAELGPEQAGTPADHVAEHVSAARRAVMSAARAVEVRVGRCVEREREEREAAAREGGREREQGRERRRLWMEGQLVVTCLHLQILCALLPAWLPHTVCRTAKSRSRRAERERGHVGEVLAVLHYAQSHVLAAWAPTVAEGCATIIARLAAALGTVLGPGCSCDD